MGKRNHRRGLALNRRLRVQPTGSGFTLLETLLTVSIIGTLATAVISSFGPSRMLASSRNVQRRAHLNDLLGAVAAFTIDNEGRTPPNMQLPAIRGPTSFSGARIIAAGFDGAEGVAVADMDGDGDLDVVGMSEDDGVRWWAQSGSPPAMTWTERIVDASFEGEEETAVGDMDGDLRPDIVAVSEEDDLVAWWRNGGGDPPVFGARVTIQAGHREVRVVDIVDMDGDGDRDVLTGSDPSGRKVRWYRNGGNPDVGNWEYRDVEDDFGHTHGIAVADLDGDGDMDVLGASNNHRDVSFWVNSGNPWQNNWTRYNIDANFHSAEDVFPADVDGDGDTDVAAIGSRGVSFWENDGTPRNDDWTETVVTTNMGGDVLKGADLDGDGKVDLVGSSSGGDKIAWWRNGGPLGFSGTAVIAAGDDADDIEDFALADLDGDTDIDIVATIEGNETVVWWENTSVTGLSQTAPVAEMEEEGKPICRGEIGETECDANGGVSLAVLIPDYIAAIPNDPSATGAVLTGYAIHYDSRAHAVTLLSPLAELQRTIGLTGPVGITNCLIWDIINDTRTCVVFE